MHRLGASCALFISIGGFLACSSTVSGGGDVPSSSSGGLPDAGADASPAPSDASPPLACAPLVEEDLPASPVAWEGAPRCAVDGFCTLYPAPTNGAPTRIRSAPGGSTWAVSVDAVYAWKGKTGRVHSVDVGTDLVAISPVSDDDVWAVGYESTVAHWNGSAWTVDRLSLASALSGVHARATDDVWAVGNFGVVGHWNGSAWSTTSLPGSPALVDVWALSANDVWATEWNGGVWHYDGAWTKITSAGTTTWDAVWAAGAGDAWIAGEKGLLRGGPSSLAPVAVPGVTGGFDAVWGSSASDVWAANGSSTFHFTGGAWTTQPARTRWLTGTSANDVTALGDTHVRHFDGTSWSDVFPVAFPAIRGAWRSPNGDVWFAGAKGTILRARDGKLRRLTTAATGAATTDLHAVWGSSADDFWLGGDSPTLFHVSGGTVCPVAHGLAPRVRAIAGSGPSDVWAVTNTGVAAHHDGKTWKPEPLEATSILAFSPTDAWATGKSLFHWDGTAWKPVDVGLKQDPMNQFGALAATGPGDVWTTAHVFLEGDRVLHYDGTTWTVAPTDASTSDAITARTPSDVWLLDWNVHHFDGTSWTQKSKVPRRNVKAAIATATELWVASEDGSILRLAR